MRQHQHRLRRVIGSGLVLLLLIAALPAAAAATTSQTNISGAVTQSYSAGPSVQSGMIVELQASNPQTIIPLHSSDIAHMLGVVVPTANAAIVLSPAAGTQQQVLVATVGHYGLLVTNQDGPIKTGDYVTISSLDGIGMKADADQTEVVGRAAGNFNGAANVLGSVKLKNQQGQATTVTIGSISLDLDITHNPLYQKSPAFVPDFVNKFATGVANKPVSTARIYLATVMLVITAFIVASILYGSMRGSMVALGRNPLSKQPIMRGLLQSMITVLIIFAVGVIAVYLLLKL